MHKVHIDFETRSRVDIKKSGAGRYCTDPSTEILCVAYALDDEPVQWGLFGYYPPIFDVWIHKGYEFVAHNAYFEWAIWKYVWKKPPPPFSCTMAKACTHGLPWQLDKLAQSLQLEERKDIEGRRLIRLFSIPNKKGEFNDPDEYEEEFNNFVEYCKQDVVVERRIDKMLPDLTPYEKKIYDMTMKINDRGLCVDDYLIHDAVSIADKLKSKCRQEVIKLTNNTIQDVTQTIRLRDYINRTYNQNLEGVNKDVIEETIAKDDVPEIVKKLLRLRLEYGRSSVAKFKKAVLAKCEDGRIRNYLTYHGASTGRWTSMVVQFQNLFRGLDLDQELCIDIIGSQSSDLMELCYSHPMSALSTCVRGIVIPEDGKKLMVADYSAIEARVLMWLAGQMDAVKLFKEEKDIYVEMARVIYGNKNLTKKNKYERQLGKQAVLGCGYQMGPGRFRVTCEGYGIIIEEALAKRAVYSYRNTYSCVPTFWEDVELAAKYTISHKRPYRCGLVKFFVKGRFLYCQLPSGRCLAYYYPGIEDKEMPWGETKRSIRYFTVDGETKSFKKTFTYGGKLTENIVQAMARDIMADAMLRLEAKGIPVILSVHDEIICEVDKDEDLLDEMIQTMCNLPAWAQGCPISAEGWEGLRYKK